MKNFMFAVKMGMRARLRILIVALGLVWLGCATESADLRLGNGSLADTYGVILVDTMTIAVSTVLLDSIPTSNTGSLLVGGYADDHLGKLGAKGIVQVGLGGNWEPSSEARFDSMILVATYSGYFYGDTTAAQTVEVHRVSRDFKTYSLPQFWIDENQYSTFYESNSLYNSSKVYYDGPVLGSRTFRPRPNSGDSLVIRLDNNLGRELLQLAQSRSEVLTDQNSFLDYFKGIFMTNSSDQPNCVFGLQTADLKIRLYYSEYSANDTFEQTVQEFPFNSGLFNFSRIESDRTGTSLEGLTLDNNELSSASTNYESYIQAGTGIVTKIRFPYVRKLIDLKDFLIVNQAQLVIEPVKNSFDQDFPLPTDLTLYATNKTNLPITQLRADYNSELVQKATFSFDQEFDKSTGYIFSITEYVQNMLSTEGNTENGLLIMPPQDELTASVGRAILGARVGNEYTAKLKVWVTIKK